MIIFYIIMRFAIGKYGNDRQPVTACTMKTAQWPRRRFKIEIGIQHQNYMLVYT